MLEEHTNTISFSLPSKVGFGHLNHLRLGFVVATVGQVHEDADEEFRLEDAQAMIELTMTSVATKLLH